MEAEPDAGLMPEEWRGSDSERLMARRQQPLVAV
jgi:hypothetical protein